MRILKNIGILALTLLAFTAEAQSDKAATARIVDEQHYVFIASSAIPLNASAISEVMMKIPGSTGGGNINLSGDNYDIKVTKDSIVAYLPYYGRSYVAPIYPEDSGIKFTSKKFEYKNTKSKRGGWEVIIKTNDVKDNVSMRLSISQNGYATLNVTSNNKQSISYNGYLSGIKARKSESK